MKVYSDQAHRSYETITALVTVSILLFYLFSSKTFLLIGLILGLVCLIIKPLAEWIHHVWMSLTKVLGKFMSAILLSLIFYIILTPIAILYKIFNRKKLIHLDQPHSMFISRDHSFDSKDLSDPW